MRFVLSLFIILFSFSNVFAATASKNDEEKEKYVFPSFLSLGIYGYGYIPMETDKDVLGYGGGGGLKMAINFTRYFGIGLSSGFTVTQPKDSSGNKLTILSDIRASIIIQRDTGYHRSGFMPWSSISLGVLSGEVNYGSYQKLEDAVGFNIVLSAGLRYNFKNVYIGIGAEYSFSRLYGDLVNNNYYNGSYYYTRKSGSIFNPSGFNIFGEVGYRL